MLILLRCNNNIEEIQSEIHGESGRLIYASVNPIMSLFIILSSFNILSTCLEIDFTLRTRTVTVSSEIVFFYCKNYFVSDVLI